MLSNATYLISVSDNSGCISGVNGKPLSSSNANRKLLSHKLEQPIAGLVVNVATGPATSRRSFSNSRHHSDTMIFTL